MKNFCAPLMTVLAFLAVFLVQNGTQAQEILFTQYESSFLQLVKPGSPESKEADKNYPFWAKVLFLDFLRYDPEIVNQDLQGACSIDRWQESLQSSPSFAQLTGAIQKYVSVCNDQIKFKWNNMLSNLYLTMMLNLNTEHHPYARQVIFSLPNGLKLKGLLALKGDGKKRPLIIIRAGIFSSVSQFFPERFLFMQLFETSPFNILVLESNSGREFIFRNQVVAVGGYDEGIVNFQVAQSLQQVSEPLSKVIESVHLLGVSFGGHGMIFTSLLSSLADRPVISSAMGICPLLNFQETIEAQRTGVLAKMGVEKYIGKRLEGIEKIIPGLNVDHLLDEMVPYLSAEYKGSRSLTAEIPLPAEMKKTLTDFWQQNHFWKYYKKVSTPVLILATEKDNVVPFANNAGLIAEGKMDLAESNLRVILLPEGMHCSIPGSYQWRPFATLLQNYFLKQSHYQPQIFTHRVPLHQRDQVESDGFHPSLDIEAGSSRFEMVLVVKDHGRIQKIPFPASETGYAIGDFSANRTMFQRWALQNVRLTIEKDNLQSPSVVARWRQ